jgi:hypothetical protein
MSFNVTKLSQTLLECLFAGLNPGTERYIAHSAYFGQLLRVGADAERKEHSA